MVYANFQPPTSLPQDAEEVIIMNGKMLAAQRAIDRMFKYLVPHTSSNTGKSLYEMYQMLYFHNPMLFTITSILHSSEGDSKPHIDMSVCLREGVDNHLLRIHALDMGFHYKIVDITQERGGKTEVICTFHLDYFQP